jgi:hypothetical protein
MKNPIACTSLIAGFCMLLHAPVYAEPADQWWSGWGMGVHEYGWSGSDESRIYITCENSTELGLSVAIRGIDPKPKSEVVFSVDGKEIRFWMKPNQEIDTQSRVGMNNLYFLFDDLRKGKKLVLSFDGLSKAFPLTGSSKGLGQELCE